MGNHEAEKKRRRKVLHRTCRHSELSNSIKCNNILIIGIPEEVREKRDRGFI